MLVNEDVSQAPCGDINLYHIVTLLLEMLGNLVGAAIALVQHVLHVVQVVLVALATLADRGEVLIDGLGHVLLELAGAAHADLLGNLVSDDAALVAGVLVGALAGYLAGRFMGTETSLGRNILMGVLGSFVGEFLFGLLGIHASGSFSSFAISVIGACICIWIGQKISK